MVLKASRLCRTLTPCGRSVCNMKLFPHPLRQSIFYGPLDQLQTRVFPPQEGKPWERGWLCCYIAPARQNTIHEVTCVPRDFTQMSVFARLLRFLFASCEVKLSSLLSTVTICYNDFLLGNILYQVLS